MDSHAPRISVVPRENRSATQQALIERADKELNIYTTMINHPELFGYFQQFAGRLRKKSMLSSSTKEILILRTAFRTGSGYEWAQHRPLAVEAGVPESVLELLECDGFKCGDWLIDVLVAVVDQLVSDHYIQQDTWDALASKYRNEELIEICMLIGNYAMIAGILNALHVPLEETQAWPEWSYGFHLKSS